MKNKPEQLLGAVLGVLSAWLCVRCIAGIDSLDGWYSLIIPIAATATCAFVALSSIIMGRLLRRNERAK
jgi:hypothetical protein